MVLEGGSFFVDGEGTLITTEQCLLNENRNPDMSREQIEQTLSDYLGIDKVVWLGEGHHEDFSTDGHIDDIAHFVAPGSVILHTPSNPAHPDHAKGVDNARRLGEATDARGRTIDVVEFDTGEAAGIPYLNLFVCNGGIVAPVAGTPQDEAALAQIRAVYPEREIVTVPADVLFIGGRRRAPLHHPAGACRGRSRSHTSSAAGRSHSATCRGWTVSSTTPTSSRQSTSRSISSRRRPVKAWTAASAS